MYYYHSRGPVGLSKSSRVGEGHLFTKPRSNIFEAISSHPNYVLYPIRKLFTYGMVANLSHKTLHMRSNLKKL